MQLHLPQLMHMLEKRREITGLLQASCRKSRWRGWWDHCCHWFPAAIVAGWQLFKHSSIHCPVGCESHTDSRKDDTASSSSRWELPLRTFSSSWSSCGRWPVGTAWFTSTKHSRWQTMSATQYLEWHSWHFRGHFMAGNWFETALAFLFLIVIFFSFWGVTM